MVFTEWLRPHQVVMAVVMVATGGFACSDTPTPTKLLDPALTEPRFTAAADFVSSVVGRGNLGAFSIQSPAHGYGVQLNSHYNTDIVVANIAIAPGGFSGWHSHPGPVLITVKTGAITFYEADDPTCSPVVHEAGTSFIEQGGTVGQARNEGTVEATSAVTFFVPAGSPTRIDAAKPDNCEL
ncbi:MAG: hypothetical protein ABI141_10760 [Gemmatimonadaceae bacterium]